MNSTRLFKKTVIAATIALASQQAVAAGFQLNAQSATGLGRAFAGDAVIADNASVMARNPAAMALFDETSMSLGFTSITSQIEVKDAKYSTFNGSGYDTVDSNYSDAGSTSVAPNIHLIVPINEKFAVGVNAYTNFGTKTEFDESFAASEYGGLTDVKSANIGVAGSYRVNEQLSFGAGLDIIYGSGKMKRTLSDRVISGGGTTVLNADADGWALGFNLGSVYEIDENNRFGLAYHYSPELKAKGDVTIMGVDSKDTLVMPLPDMLEFSGFHKIVDTKFAVHYSVQWIGWSSFDKITIEDAGVDKKYEWKDGMHYAIGGTYYLNQDWTLRAGYMHDTSAQDQLTSISVPDSNRNWFSGGFTYHLDTKSNIDFGFTYLLGQDVDVKETTYVPNTGNTIALSSIEGVTRANAILVGLQYSRSF
ncbi:outer membrane protein transport protein [Vibrio tapetis subsp. quintayensis]|uniref:outer membrane protein transport protein n=1 Tax=Vibrio tapetis TaxID=52443 RepID=UPI0025B5D743|nr:outer membrane protein transport protein [Vibrio tapetis]MDN3680583.1 outer membrane protein transport protein [Vibrio tapetis subsp. quintayensis]